VSAFVGVDWGLSRHTEGVGDFPYFLVAERDEETVGDKLDVLAHELGVHADERDGEGV